ncbi:hypothetical protein B9Z55_004261 [Caenorhabditis nigoni]|uniref:Serine/threonine-protein phosphatase n=1 Tax=Caenorhabditis nigoni TaxID=1611254 RepID=A0A2G5UVN9_9PELO|nr:hypothetical protein B9Z55_004261 [Caenorhabditis nigoni]
MGDDFPVGEAQGSLKAPIAEGAELPTNGKVYEFLRSMINRLVDEWMPGVCQTLIEEREYIELCYRAREAFWADKVWLEIEPPITICGDIHGQYEDLLAMLSMFSFPPHFPLDKDAKVSSPPQRYLFLGDYVDRGPFSIETMSLLFALRLLYPDKFYLLRGNHECRAVNTQYGFYFECTKRFSVSLYEAFQYTFNCMPICARVGKRILCMHGGISADLLNVEDLEVIPRPFEVADQGVPSDLCWSDPTELIKGYEFSPRGAGCLFGREALDDFLARHDLEMIVRAHQVVMDGYEFFGDKKLVTIFSAPSYCGHFDNFGAVMHVNERLECTINSFCENKVMTNREAAAKAEKIKRSEEE